MVQLQVACHKNANDEEQSSSNCLMGHKKNNCDIISELLFHNDGANDSVNTAVSTARAHCYTTSSKISNPVTACSDDRNVVKSNTVMFEYREQPSNLGNEDVAPFSSFFHNDCDLSEQVHISLNFARYMCLINGTHAMVLGSIIHVPGFRSGNQTRRAKACGR